MREHMQIYEQYKEILEEEGAHTRELEARIEGGGKGAKHSDTSGRDAEALAEEFDEGKLNDAGKRPASHK